MGALLSTPSPQQPDAPIKPNQECRGLFNRRNGDNIPECLHPPSPSQYVTVFFNWTDRMHNDEQLMALVAARIKARDGIITPEPVHHDLRWCMSLRVPKHHEATDVSIADCAKCVADWIRQQIIYQGVNIDRDYLFRSSHLPAWKGSNVEPRLPSNASHRRHTRRGSWDRMRPRPGQSGMIRPRSSLFCADIFPEFFLGLSS